MTTTDPSSPAATATTDRRKRGISLTTRLMITLLPIALIPLLIMGSTAFSRSRTLLLQQITGQIVNLEEREADALQAWITTKQVRLSTTIRQSEFREYAAQLTSSRPGSNSFSIAQANLIEMLEEVNPSITSALFNQFLFVDIDGTVLASTEEDWLHASLSGQSYFHDSIANNQQTTIFLNQPSPLYEPIDESSIIYEGFTDVSNEVVLITSIHAEDEDGQFLGYVLGISEAASIQRTLEEPLSLLPDSKVFLVSNDGIVAGITLVHGFVLVNPSDGQLQAIQNPYTEGQVAYDYESFDGLPVIGIYNFEDGLDIGILIEAPQSTAFSHIYDLTAFSTGLVIAVAIFLSIFIIIFTRSLLSPLNEVVSSTEKFAEGDWSVRAPDTRGDEIGRLGTAFNNMANELTKMYRSLESEVEERTAQVVAASEVAHLATSATTKDELLSRTVNLIVERFNYYHASIFLFDEAKENLVVEEATGQIGRNLKSQNYSIPTSRNSIVSWVANHNQPRVASDVTEDSAHLSHELLPETRAEVGIPISIGSDVLGVLDVQSEQPSSFDPQTIGMLSTLADQIASAIQNFRLMEGTEIDLLEVNQLYRASRQIADATSPEEILQAVNSALQSTQFISAIYAPEGSSLKLIENTDQSVSYADLLPPMIELSLQQAQTYFPSSSPIVIRDVIQPASTLHSELLTMPQQLGCYSAAFLPILVRDVLAGIIIMASRDKGAITQTALQPYASLIDLTTTAIEKVGAQDTTSKRLDELQVLSDFGQAIGNETSLEKLYYLIHGEIKELIGEVYFYIALYDKETDHISIPYLYEGGSPDSLEAFPLGEGLTSILIKTKQPLMLVENTEMRAQALGAKMVGAPAKSWLGVPLIVAGEPIGVLAIQDTEHEHRFTEDDLRLMNTLSTQVASVIYNARLLDESKRRALQLQTAAEIARDTSGTLERDELLRRAINLMRDRFDFYHASVFLLDSQGEYAIVQESTGEAGRTMKTEGYKIAVGSQSVIGYVTANKEPLVVGDVTEDPNHQFNPLLPETSAELGIPLIAGNRVVGALDVQSTQAFSFTVDDIEVLQILADQLAIAVVNAELFTETQEHLAQHRLIHHVTTVAASSTSLEESLSSAVQGLRVTLGDRVSILLADLETRELRVVASAGYEDDVLGLQVSIGEGITGWVAEHREPLLINNVLNDPRYISGKETVRSELAVPLNYRGNLLGVLNIESDELNAFDQHDQDILGTLAGSLSAIIINARLTDRQRQLFDVTNKIRRSANIETILETTASELTKALQARRTRIQVGGESLQEASSPGILHRRSNPPISPPDNGKEGAS